MKIKSLWAVAFVAIGVMVGCVKTGSVTEKAPVASLSAYKSASVVVQVPSDLKNADSYKTAFGNAIAQRLKDKKIFADVTPDGGDVSISVKVTKIDDGSTALRAISTNANDFAAEISASVELFEKGSKPIGAFDVTGNSKNKGVQTSVGGVNTAAMEDATGKALTAAAEEIALYLEKKR